MGNFNRGDRGGFGGKKRPGNDRDFNRGDRGDRERPAMHRAICNECGRPCEVPFRPSGDKPVFCSDCFGRRESSPEHRSERPERRDSFRNERRDSNEFSFDEKPMFRAICDKCHNECEVPFRPSGDKPVFCNDCFSSVRNERGPGNAGASNADQYKKQFETINSKLDYVLKMLSAKNSGEKSGKELKSSKEEKPLKATEEMVEKDAEPKKSPKIKKEVASKKEEVEKKIAEPKKAVKKAVVKKKK